MKKTLALLVAVLTLVCLLALSVCAEDAIFVSWAGNDENDGASHETAKKTPGGAAEAMPNGGTMVVSGKAYINKSLTFPKTTGPVTITSVYYGMDYKNAVPANNPACAFKMASNAKWTIESEVIFDDIIIFQENGQNTLVVADGGILTINENVIAMSNHDYFWNIVVEKGGKATINGGTFSKISGAGEITIGEGATVLEGDFAPAKPEDGNPTVAFHSYTGNDKNDGVTAETPKKTLGNLTGTGVINLLRTGGTVVAVGKSYIGQNYTLPELGGPLTFTSVYDGVDYKNAEPANNPACAFKIADGATLTIKSDVVFDDIILFQEHEQNTIKVTEGATLIVTDKVVFMSNHPYHYKIVLEPGTVAILSEEAQKQFVIEGSGEVITYNSPATDKKVIKMVKIGRAHV